MPLNETFLAEQAEQPFREFADSMPHILWTASPDGMVDYLNKVYCDYTGVTFDVDSQDWVNALHPDDLDYTLAVWSNAVATGQNYSTEFRCIHKPSGEYRWQAVSAKPIRDQAGNIIKWYGICTDIHESKIAIQKANFLANRLETTLESMTDGFIMLDWKWRATYVNKAAENALQRSRQALLGKAVWEEFPEMVDSRVYRECQRARAERRAIEFEYDASSFNRWFDIRIYPSEDGVSVYFRDITTRKATEQEIQRLAFHDQLTGLPNRQLLQDRLQQAMLASARSKQLGAVIFIDLDNFKTLNDTQGHGKGDLLLQQVAQRLTSCVRASDTVARLGGDEFVVVLEGLSRDPMEAATQAELVGETILTALNQPYDLQEITHISTSSIGVTLFDEEISDIEELLKRADLAMYRAKAAGRNAICFYDPAMQQAVSVRMALETGLRESLRNKLFTLHFQPQLDKGNQITGAEALLRWVHPSYKNVSPTVFIPVAEETGLIFQLGRWVMEEACAQLAEWSKNTDTAQLSLSINVSARQFRHPDFVADVLDIVGSSGANPERLKMEITESLLISDMEDAITKMAALQAHGIRFSLDDFGTGYSSLSYLRHLPLEQLKIDRSFINRVPGDSNDAAIVQAIIAMGHTLGMKIIAEGVETEKQRAFLSENGCNAYQGFLFSKAIPADEFTVYLRSHRSGTV